MNWRSEFGSFERSCVATLNVFFGQGRRRSKTLRMFNWDKFNRTHCICMQSVTNEVRLEENSFVLKLDARVEVLSWKGVLPHPR